MNSGTWAIPIGDDTDSTFLQIKIISRVYISSCIYQQERQHVGSTYKFQVRHPRCVEYQLKYIYIYI